MPVTITSICSPLEKTKGYFAFLQLFNPASWRNRHNEDLTKKEPMLDSFRLVARTGIEPVTFGL